MHTHVYLFLYIHVSKVQIYGSYSSLNLATGQKMSEGKAVIVTVPLTVLQQKIHFQPPLSSAFHAALLHLEGRWLADVCCALSP